MQISRTALGTLLAGWMASGIAQDLPLPQGGGGAGREPAPSADGGPVFLRPTKSIKPPVVPASPIPASDLTKEQIVRAESRMLLDQKAAQTAHRETEEKVAAALKRIVVMQKSAGQKLDQKAPPPNAVDGKAVTLIGIDASKDTVRGLEGFFGVQLTPDNEKKVLETLRKGMADTSKQPQKIEVLGWWPKEGVMAVGVSPEG